jgi:acyl dehydratase
MLERGAKFEGAPVGPFDAAAVKAYAAASGDENPLHVDADLARALGFDAPPVHGMLLMAQIEPALEIFAPDWRLVELNAQFVEPLLTGEAAMLSARILRADAQSALARVTIQGPRRAPCLLAEAQLARRESAV